MKQLYYTSKKVLKNWSIGLFTCDGYAYPKQKYLHLRGTLCTIYNGILGCRDMRDIITTNVMKFDGNTITFSNSVVYELGEIDSKFSEWMNKNGYTIEQYIKTGEDES